MKRFWTVTLVAGVLCLAATGSAQSRGMGRVVGVVVDESGSPIADVTVRTATMDGSVIESASDAAGKWTLAGIGRGEWLVTFLKSGYGAKRIKAIIEKELEKSNPIKITLPKA